MNGKPLNIGDDGGIHMKSESICTTFSNLGRVMVSFRDDCREDYVISNSYGMRGPLASRFKEEGRTAEGGLTRP